MFDLRSRRFDPLFGKLLSVEDPTDKDAGGDTVSMSQKALDTRIKRAERSAKKRFLDEYQLTEEEIAEFAASRGTTTDKPTDKKPADKAPEKPATAPTFDPEAFKADLLKSVSEQFKTVLTERETAAKQSADAAAEKAARRTAAEKAGVKAIDLAMPLFDAHLSGLDEEKRKAVKPEEFFGALVKAHPTLGTVIETPADSGKNGEQKPTPAKDGGPKFDATKAKPAEVQARREELRAKLAAQ